MRRLRAISVLPSLFTLGNLVCGFFAIVVASRVEAPRSEDVPKSAVIQSMTPTQFFKDLNKEDPVHNCMLAGWLIFLAMIFDALDGHVARLTKAATDFGAQLDSLCDVVTFGVAPGILLVKMCPGFTYHHTQMIWIIAAAFAGCAALRLARFNVEADEEDDHMNFSGLPSPAAAAVVAGFAILFYTLRRENNEFVYAGTIDAVVQRILPFLTLATALLMVSRIPYPHVVNHLFRGQKSFGHLVGLLFALAAVMIVRGVAVPIVCVGYALSGPLRYAWQELFQRKPHDEPLF